MKKTWYVITIVMLLALLVGCAGPAATTVPEAATEAPKATEAAAEEPAATEAAATEAAPAAEDITVGAILFGRDSFFENIQNGMQQAADDAGVELLVSVHDHDIAQETRFIEDYVARGVDAIVITPESLDASVAALKAAKEAGVTIVCFNTCLNEQATKELVSAFYETDQSSLGYQTGEYLVKWVAEQEIEEVNVGILQCDRFEACKRRGDGFRQALEDGGLKWTEVANQEGFMPDEGSAVAENILQANPNINILWSENEGGTVGEVIAVRSMGVEDKVKVFGTDISPQLAEMLKADDAVLQAVTGQSPRKMGYDSVMNAIEIAKGGEGAGYNVVPNAFFSRADVAAVEEYLATYGAPAEAEPAEEAAPAKAAEDVTVGAILFGRDSFFENIQNGMQQAADEAGLELLVSVHDHDIAQETRFIEDYVARGVDAIVITPESLDASVAALRAAKEAGVTIICFNTCLNEEATAELVSAFYETDQSSLGYQTGEYLVKWVAEQGIADVNVGILQCDRFEACKRRGDGFRAALEDGGLKWTEVANQEGFMPDEGSAVAENILQANPNINILWSENEGGTVGEVIAVRSMGVEDKVKVFGTDISPQLAEMLKADDGVLQAVTGQSPRKMGYDSVMNALAIAQGGEPGGYNVVPNAFFSRADVAAVDEYLATYGAPAEAEPAEEAAPAKAAEDITVGAILFGRDSFFENIQNGMQKAATDGGFELLVSVHDHDIAQETRFIEDYVARGVDAIVITPESLDASVAALKAAKEAGVTIVCFNTCLNEEATNELVSAFYETDQASLGYQTGEYMAKWVADKQIAEANVGILQCDRFEACKRRGDGFRQALADAGVKWTEVANQEGYMPDEGSAVAENILQANPNINILWSENEGGTVGEVIAVRSMGLEDTVKVFGTDISPQLAEMLLADDDVLQAVTGQSPRTMGYDSVNNAFQIAQGGEPGGYNVVPNAFFSRDDTQAVQDYLAEY